MTVQTENIPASAGKVREEGAPPLSGIRVLDLTHVIAGPFGTTMLADLGAEVVKVERPGVGDDLRSAGRYSGRDDHENMFNANNRSKKSITIDLKQEAGRLLPSAWQPKPMSWWRTSPRARRRVWVWAGMTCIPSTCD